MDVDSLARGQHALANANWREAKRCFENALAHAPCAQAHDGLGLALWWLNEIPASHHQRTLAYQQYKKRGNARRAAMMAVWLAREQLFLSGNVSAMKGWFARAERLLGDEGRVVEGAWLTLARASVLVPASELEQVTQRVLAEANYFQDDDLEAMALGFAGIARVMQGQVAQGMANLDEAMTAALSGEIQFIYTSEIFCLMLSACDLVGDLERTGQWCRTAQAYAEEHQFPFLAATCRVTYGSLLTATGQWDRAENELLEAIRSFESGHTALRAQAVIKLADLRIWQGRLDEAEILLAGFEDQGLAAVPIARLALARGDQALARAVLEQALSPNAAPALDQAPPLRLLVDVQLAQNDLDGARDTTARLTALANAARSDLLLAQAELAEGQVLRFEHAPDAVRPIQAALDRLRAYDQSLLAARARFELAQLARDDDRAAAITWARAALASFERMGAKQDANQVMNFLRQLGAPPSSRARPGALSTREQEVLELLGQGLTNREIAERLVVSPKTVEHHVSQVLAKLGARSRAEAAAMAARQ